MGCGASTKQDDDVEDTQTRSVIVKPDEDVESLSSPTEQEPPEKYNIPASLRGTLRAAPSIVVRTTKAADKLAEKRRQDAEDEEKRRRKPGNIAKSNAKTLAKMAKANDQKTSGGGGNFLGVAPSATPKSGGGNNISSSKSLNSSTSGRPSSKSGLPPPAPERKRKGSTTSTSSTDASDAAAVVSSPSKNPPLLGSMDNSAFGGTSLSSTTTTTQHLYSSSQPPTFTDADFEGFSTFRMLGKGAFGSTFECGLKSRKIVAVKVIEFGDLDDGSDDMQNLRNEIGLMKRFHHPNIVQYYGFTEDTVEKKMNIFMEYVTGGTLNSYMAKFEGTGVPIEICQDWTRQMCEGVGYLHEQGVVHRDIKGANVLMTLNGEVKLADFGCSKSIDDSVSKTRGCQTMVGTPYWMAPEVLKCEPYGTKSDVWSIGCTVVEMLTGKPAWPECTNMWAAVYKIANSKGLPPNIPKNLPKTMMNFLERVFERNPDKRSTCKELLAHPWLKQK